MTNTGPLFRRVPSRTGLKVMSRHGWLYLGVNTPAYLVQIGIGRLSIAFERRIEKRDPATKGDLCGQ